MNTLIVPVIWEQAVKIKRNLNKRKYYMTQEQLNKHIWEGWTVQDFINDLEPIFQYAKITNKAQLKEWCKDNQPYYKKHIPEVVKYFSEKYNIK